MSDIEKNGRESQGLSPKKPTAPMLINHLSRMFDECFRSSMPQSSSGCMTQNSCRFILRYLAHHEFATQQELTENAEMKAPTISVAIKRMEEEGLVRRVPDERDQRCFRVSLTQAGERYHELVHQNLRALDQRMMAGVSPEEEEMLVSILLRMRENLRSKDTK